MPAAENDFPFDLVDAVISRTDDEGTTARACSLVCHLWHRASRPHAFRTVKLTSGEKLAIFEQILETDPAIGELVHQVIVHPHNTPIGDMPGATPWIGDFTANLPSQLSKVKTMKFVEVCDFGEFMGGEFFHRLAAFKSVERLELRDCAFALNCLFAIIASFPNVRHLSVGLIYFAINTQPSPPPQLHLPQLQTLEMDVGHRYAAVFEGLLDWVLASPSRTSLRQFSIAVHMVHAAVAGRFLREIGNMLEELELKLMKFRRAGMEYDMIKEDINLSVCPALHTLIIDGVEPACSAVLSFLSEISSPHLRTLVFSFAAPEDPASLQNFSPLDEALAHPRFAELDEVRFLYNGVPDLEIVEGKVRSDLPGVDGRGILRVIADPGFRQPVMTRLF